MPGDSVSRTNESNGSDVEIVSRDNEIDGNISDNSNYSNESNDSEYGDELSQRN